MKSLPLEIAAKVKERETFEYQGIVYDCTWEDDNDLIRHGGPWDRGAADSYYGRMSKPHYYVGGTGTSAEVKRENMTETEIMEYYAGYEYNEESGNKKDW